MHTLAGEPDYNPTRFREIQEAYTEYGKRLDRYEKALREITALTTSPTAYVNLLKAKRLAFRALERPNGELHGSD